MTAKGTHTHTHSSTHTHPQTQTQSERSIAAAVTSLRLLSRLVRFTSCCVTLFVLSLPLLPRAGCVCVCVSGPSLRHVQTQRFLW